MLVLFSCEKAEEALPDTQSGSYINVAPAITDGAVLVAARSHTTQESPVAGFPDIDISLDIPVGIFFSGGAQVKAGEVQIDGSTLDFIGNVYTLQNGGFTAGADQFMFDSRAWTVGGEGAIPAGNYVNTKALPTLGEINVESSLQKGLPYTVSIASVAQADSLIYLLGDQTITVGANTRSVTFSAQQTNALSTGQSIVQVAAFNLSQRSAGSQTIYLVNEDIRQRSVTIE